MKVIQKLKAWWAAETPRLAKFLQYLAGAIAALPIYYAALPDEFKRSIPDSYLRFIAIGGGVVALLLQFFHKKENV